MIDFFDFSKGRETRGLFVKTGSPGAAKQTGAAKRQRKKRQADANIFFFILAAP